MSQVLAIDIGGTNFRLALADESGALHNEYRFEGRLSDHRQSTQESAEIFVIKSLCEAIGPLLKQHDVSAIGIGFPGFFHGNTGILAASPNLPLLREFALTKKLSEQLDIPVSAQNDALCAAIGEHRFGAGQGKESLLHITLGTGVGAGLILQREPYSGEHGMAMEFGHLCVEKNGRSCGCGNNGCLETYASATAVALRVNEKSGEKVTAHQVYQQALNGNRDAAVSLEEAGSYLGQGIAEAVKLLDIGTVTISGGLCGAWKFLHPPLVTTLNNNLIPPLQGKVDVLRSTLGDSAGLLGAATIAIQS